MAQRKDAAGSGLLGSPSTRHAMLFSIGHRRTPAGKLLGPVNTYAVAALSVKNPPDEARAAGLGDSKAKIRNDDRGIFDHNPSGRGREPPLPPRSSRQGLRLPRCTGGSRPPSQRSHTC